MVKIHKLGPARSVQFTSAVRIVTHIVHSTRHGMTLEIRKCVVAASCDRELVQPIVMDVVIVSL